MILLLDVKYNTKCINRDAIEVENALWFVCVCFSSVFEWHQYKISYMISYISLVSIVGGCKIQDFIKNNTYYVLPWMSETKANPGAVQWANVCLSGVSDMEIFEKACCCGFQNKRLFLLGFFTSMFFDWSGNWVGTFQHWQSWNYRHLHQCSCSSLSFPVTSQFPHRDT